MDTMTGIGTPKIEPVSISFTPPVNLDAEEGLIGCILLSPRAWNQAAEVRPEDFYSPWNRAIWSAAVAVSARGGTIDPITVIGEMSFETDRARSWTMAYMANLAGSVVARSMAGHYASIVMEFSERRRILQAADCIIERAASTSLTVSAADLAGMAITDLNQAVQRQGDVEDLFDVADRVVDSLDKPIRATSTGLPRLDAALAGGWHENRFYVVQGAGKSGKSTFMLTCAYNQTVLRPADDPDPRKVLYLNLEMKSDELVQRLMARHMEVNGLDFLNPSNRQDKDFCRAVYQTRDCFMEKGLSFRRRARMPFDQMMATIARIGLSGEYKGIYVDYLQLVGGRERNSNMVEHVENIAQSLAEAAAQYPLWIVAGAQANEDGSTRYGKGALNACDMTLNIRSGEEIDGCPKRMSLGMAASRYTPDRDIGTELEPAYELDAKRGPHWLELPAR